MRFLFRLTSIFIVLSFNLVLLSACGGRTEYLLEGRTMGTTYHIKVVADRSTDMGDVKAKVDRLLVQINRSMSTYQPDSEISRFNAFREKGKPFEVSGDFLRVMLSAREIFRLTEGAMDSTVNPLVNLWGFGKKGAVTQEPSSQAVADALRLVGFDQIDVVETGYLVKKQPDVTVDLAAIAKGYGVDQVAVLLHGLGFRDYLVEIGGEVYAAGRRADNKTWRVGINQPRPEAAADAVYEVVPLQNRAMATSGDYRNFERIGQTTFSHIIDPRTGYPVQNGVVSASVIADNCTLADGLATALMVMGPEKGIALLDRLREVEGMIITRQADGTFRNHLSKGMVDATEH